MENYLKYKDIAADKGIMRIFQENFETEFAEFFENQSGQNLDFYVMYMFAEKLINPFVTSENFSKIVVAIIQINLQKWKKFYNIATSEINELTDVETRTKTGTLNTENELTTQNINSEKVFNDSAFFENAKNNNTENTQKTDTYNLTETITNNVNVTEKQKEGINFAKTFELKKIIIKEIINEITLKIY